MQVLLPGRRSLLVRLAVAEALAAQAADAHRLMESNQHIGKIVLDRITADLSKER